MGFKVSSNTNRSTIVFLLFLSYHNGISLPAPSDWKASAGLRQFGMELRIGFFIARCFATYLQCCVK